jgi:hypothetical protein
MTVLKTKSAIVNGKQVKVEQVKLETGRQAIGYLVNGKLLSADAFWNDNPKFLN